MSDQNTGMVVGVKGLQAMIGVPEVSVASGQFSDLTIDNLRERVAARKAELRRDYDADVVTLEDQTTFRQKELCAEYRDGEFEEGVSAALAAVGVDLRARRHVSFDVDECAVEIQLLDADDDIQVRLNRTHTGDDKLFDLRKKKEKVKEVFDDKMMVLSRMESRENEDRLRTRIGAQMLRKAMESLPESQAMLADSDELVSQMLKEI